MSDQNKLLDYRIGIWSGLGLTQEVIASMAGVALSTVQYHIQINRPDILHIKEIAAIGATRALSQRYAELEAKYAEDYNSKARSRRDRLYEELEKLLERPERDGLKLATIKEGLDREEGKSVNRIKMDTTRQEIKSIDGPSMEAINALAEEMRQLNQRSVPLLETSAIESTESS